MAEQEGAGRYWCHMCAVAVRPAEGEPEMKSPHCHSGFLVEMETARSAAAADGEHDGAVPAAAHHERAEPVRVARGEHLVGREEQERVGPRGGAPVRGGGRQMTS